MSSSVFRPVRPPDENPHEYALPSTVSAKLWSVPAATDATGGRPVVDSQYSLWVGRGIVSAYLVQRWAGLGYEVFRSRRR